MRYSAFTVFLLISIATFVECGKDPVKRKLLTTENLEEKPANEIVESVKGTLAEAESTPEAASGSPSDKKVENTATFSITVSSDPLAEDEAEESAVSSSAETDLAVVPKPRPGMQYLTQIQQLFTQLLTIIGFRSKVERKHRGLEFDVDNNEIESYRDGLRTTIGAAMGQAECIKKTTCRVGKYLKTVKGKELIIVLLEKMTPSNWMESVRMLKDSAVYNEQCEYKCL